MQAVTNTRLFFCQNDIAEANKAQQMPFNAWARLCEGVLLIEQTNKEDSNYRKQLEQAQIGNVNKH